MFLWKAIPLAAIFAPPVWAQLNMAQCATGFDWNKNSLGQDPCTVSSILGASCRGLMDYPYPPLTNSNQYYLPPRANHPGDLMCDCNTVIYSLNMACVSCQGGQTYSWTQWISECSSVYVSKYPVKIPPGTVVPRWAYYDITSFHNQTWNDSVAISIGWGPEELLKLIDTVAPPASPPPILPRQVMTTTLTPDPKTTPIFPTTGITVITKTPSGLSNPTIPNDPTTSPVLTSPTTLPGPIIPTSSTTSPESLIPTSHTDSSGPTITTGTTNSPGPTRSTSLPPAISTSTTNSPGPTRSTSLPPAISTSTRNVPRPSNTSNTRSGTNGWVMVVVLLLWALV